MALDLHSKITITEIVRSEITNDDVVSILIGYKVKRGSKIRQLWVLPSDFRGTGIFPVCYQWLGKYANVLTLKDEVIYTGSHADCKKFVQIANKQYM